MWCWGNRRRSMEDTGPNLLMGILIGAAAVTLLDARKREDMKQMLRDWLDKGQEKLQEAKDTATRVKKAVRNEAEKTNENLNEEDVNPFEPGT